MSMSQMPEQEYVCPNCGNRVKARIFEVFCPMRGCNWMRMDAVMSPNPFETDVEPERDGSPLGCLILVVSSFVSLFILYQITQAILT